MKALREYLIHARAANAPHLQALVLGNPSADMDSVVSSFALSWLCGSRADHPPYSPVINCSRNELKLRIDIVRHLSNFGIDDQFLADNVLFADDLQDADASKVESVALVDFNQINKELEAYGFDNKVHYIVDHHVDDGLYGDTLKEKEI